MIEAPWTAQQVAKLNEWQACGWVHEFTCPTAHREGRALVAAPDGWHCLRCGYHQSWAHEFMFNGAPPNPVERFFPAKNGAQGSERSDEGNLPPDDQSPPAQDGVEK